MGAFAAKLFLNHTLAVFVAIPDPPCSALTLPARRDMSHATLSAITAAISGQRPAVSNEAFE
jgi:sugar (pentulose or hexulose) kinase